MFILKGWKELMLKTCRTASIIFTILSILSILFDIQSSFANTWSKIAFLILILAVAVIIALLQVFILNKSKCIKINSRQLVLRYGDIFKSKAKIKVIAVNRCFDMVSDDRIIAKSSLHGQFVDRYCASKMKNAPGKEKQDVLAELQEQVNKQLQHYPENVICKAEKDQGNVHCYPAGTIVPIEMNHTTYYLLGLTKMNKDLVAHCTPEEYATAMYSLIDYCNQNANDRTVHMPLIGSSKLSRLNLAKQDILTAMLSLLTLKHESLSFDATIVVGKRDRHNIAISRYV